MKQRKPRIAVLAVGRSTFDVDYAQTVFAQRVAGAAEPECGDRRRAAGALRSRRRTQSLCHPQRRGHRSAAAASGHLYRRFGVYRNRRQARGAAGVVDVSGSAHRRASAPQFLLRREPRRAHAEPQGQSARERAWRTRQQGSPAADPGRRHGRGHRAPAGRREDPRRRRSSHRVRRLQLRSRPDQGTIRCRVGDHAGERLPRQRQGAARLRRRRTVCAPRQGLQESGRDGSGRHAQDAQGVFQAQGAAPRPRASRASPCAAGPSSSPNTVARPAAPSRS